MDDQLPSSAVERAQADAERPRRRLAKVVPLFETKAERRARRLKDQVVDNDWSSGAGAWDAGWALEWLMLEALDDDFDAKGCDRLLGELGLDRDMAEALMRTARLFDRDLARRYDFAKLDAVARYWLVTEEAQRGTRLTGRARLRGEGGLREVDIEQATAEEMERAIETYLELARRPIPRLLRDRVRRVEEAVRDTPDSPARIEVQRARDGTICLFFVDIPIDRLDVLVKALREHLSDPEEPLRFA